MCAAFLQICAKYNFFVFATFCHPFYQAITIVQISSQQEVLVFFIAFRKVIY